MIWQEFDEYEGKIIYAKVDSEGKIGITAERGYPELDAYLAWVEAGNNPADFWKQEN